MFDLPIEFETRMRSMLEDEYEEFRASYEKKRKGGLRLNTMRMDRDRFLAAAPWDLTDIPWAPEGFYYDTEEDHPGKHPAHEAGMYYIQEPSAMSVAAASGVRPGERVLDLCAAPGGKTTQLAARMCGEGLLISNEIHPARAKILSQNVERMGIANCIVTNETSEMLADHFPGFFDRIIVDAPCSGEGMFRKEEQALLNWSPANVTLCAERQREILANAVRMLKRGGTLVYSTCTFAPEENEETIGWLLENYSGFTVVRPDVPDCIAHGLAIALGTEDTCRLWPHKLDGEGHFLAVLRYGVAAAEHEENVDSELGSAWGRGYAEVSESRVELHGRGEQTRKKQRPEKKGKNAGGKNGGKLDEAVGAFKDFAKSTLKKMPEGIPLLFGEQLYLMPEDISLAGLKVLRPGLHVGTLAKNRLEPAHALSHALTPADASCVDLAWDDPAAAAYLHGESITVSDELPNGWTLVAVEGCTLGWGKVTNGTLKNHFPKGLRR